MKSLQIFLPLYALLTVSQAWAGVQTPENTKWIGTTPAENILDSFTLTPEQVDAEGFGTLRFAVSDRNIWNSSVSSYHLDWKVTQSQWNSVFGRPPRARVGVGSVIEECVLGVCAKAGAAAGIELEAYFLPFVKLDFDPGTFDAKVQYKPSVVYQFSGLGTDFVRLDTSDGFSAGGSEFKLDAPILRLETGVNIETNINLFAEACLFGYTPGLARTE